MKHRRSFSKRKRITRWFASDQTYNDPGASTLVGPGILTQILAIHERTILQLPNLVQVNERHTIDAIRGQIVAYGSDPDSPGVLHMGILVVELDPTGIPVAFSPVDSAEAGKSWMWLHHMVTPPQVSQGTTWLSTSTVNVHIKSKRVLRENQALVLMSWQTAVFSAGVATTLGNAQIQPYLRTLVSRPE